MSYLEIYIDGKVVFGQEIKKKCPHCYGKGRYTPCPSFGCGISLSDPLPVEEECTFCGGKGYEEWNIPELVKIIKKAIQKT